VAVCLSTSVPVSALVLTGVPLLARNQQRRPGRAFRLMRLANRIGVLSDQRMERERRRRGSADYRAATGVMRDVLVRAVNESYEDELDLVSCPVSMVWGAEDREVPIEVAERVKERLSARGVAVSLTALAGVGHFVPTESPAALTAGLRRDAAQDAAEDAAVASARLAAGRRSLLAPDGSLNAFLRAGQSLGGAVRNLLD
jgi:pimeloyl-ACP methyl ester carboxylesterase